MATRTNDIIITAVYCRPDPNIKTLTKCAPTFTFIEGFKHNVNCSGVAGCKDSAANWWGWQEAELQAQECQFFT
jgi:hypothetical protein